MEDRRRWCIFSQPATGSGIIRLLPVSASQGFFQKVVGMCQCISAFRTSIFHWLKASAGCTLPFMRLAALGDIGELWRSLIKRIRRGFTVSSNFESWSSVSHAWFSIVSFSILRSAWLSASIWPVVSYEFQWVRANKYSPSQWNPQLTTHNRPFCTKEPPFPRPIIFGMQPLVFEGVTLPLFHKSTIPCFFLALYSESWGFYSSKKKTTDGCSAPPEIPKLEDHHFQVPCGCFQK